MRRKAADHQTESVKIALFDAVERAYAIAIKVPLPRKAAEMHRLEQVARAGAEIAALATTLSILKRG